jgi:penicillin amidase
MSVPGIPAVVAGRNDSIAWGVTNAMADDADFYVEQIDSTNQERYLYNGSWRPLTFIDDTIQVRGDSDISLRIRLTHHGPIVSDIVTPLQKAHYPFVASMRWTGFEIDDQIEAFNKIDRAENWEQFTAGVREFAVPGQNFVYGDVKGNIGYWCGVRLPIRGRQSSLFPLPGWDINAEWKGFVPFHQLPHLYNPPEGYIATANNKIVDDSYPYYISDLWEPPSRIVRLREVLGKNGELFAVADFERLQNDQFSHFAKEMVPYIMAIFRDSTHNTPEEQRTLEYLRNWNFMFTREDIGTSIFQQFFVRLLENIYKDEMGDDLFHDFVVLGNIPIRVTARLMQEGTSVWFDDVTTEVIETRDIIIRKSLRQALDMLRRQSGNDMRKWRWGDLHTVTLRHPFGLQKPLGTIFNLGPYPVGGGSTTLTSGEYSYTEPFTVTVGPSFRQIFDMANALEVRSVLPSGQSGQVFNKCYDDQTKLWLNGGYRIARSDEQGGGWQRLRLEPAP